MSIEWTTKPGPIPGKVDDKITVEDVKFRIDNLRVIGDAGDTRTTKTDFTVDWDSTKQPMTIVFSDAPTGLYSRIAILADGHITNHSWQIEGKVEIGSNTEDFVIQDDNPLSLSLGLDKMLQPGKSMVIRLEVDFSALKSIDFSMLDVDDGKRELDTNDPQMPAFRMELQQRIKIEGVSGGTGVN